MISYEDRQRAQRQIEEMIKNFSYPELSSLTTKEKKIILSRIENDISSYLIEYNNLKTQLMAVTSRVKNFEDKEAAKAENKRIYMIYKVWEETHKDVQAEAILKKGYVLIEQLREAFTGKRIKYIVGFEGSVNRGNRQLINKELSLAEMLSYSSINVNWGASISNIFKLRASASATDFQNEYEEAKNRTQQSFATHSQSLYLILTKAITGQYHKTNSGNVYEAYQEFRRRGYPDKSNRYSMTSNPTNPDIDEIIEVYQKVRKGTQSFITGGDWEDEQYKLLTQSPSIASMNTIEIALKAILQQIILDKNINITEHGIKQIFSQEFDTKIKYESVNIINEIDQYLNNLTK